MSEAPRPYQRNGALESCVLALLQHESSYGFDLIRRLRLADGLVTSEGTIYPLLARLRKSGLTETKWKVSESGPPRRYYLITEQGKAAFSQFRRHWITYRDSVDALLKAPDGDLDHE
jgi:PadR family transcriptional regulator, regulatory protein PadR